MYTPTWIPTRSDSSRSSSYSSYNHQQNTSIWAKSLEQTLVRNSIRSTVMEEMIGKWISAIKRSHKKPEAGELPLTTEEKNIATWYREQSKSKSYQASNWKIPPERAMLFQKFRSDPFYHLKNIVELVMRDFVEADLHANGYEMATVYRTSDTDDVSAWVDLIVEIPGKKHMPTEYFGIDIAVSSNEEYLEQKALRTETECREFNAYTGKRGMYMDREVYSFSPATISYFLSTYMRCVGKWIRLTGKDVLFLFDESVKKTASSIQQDTSNTVHGVLNGSSSGRVH